MFVELIVKLAKYLYSTHEAHTRNEIADLKTERQIKTEASSSKVSEAFTLFMRQNLIPFHKKNKIEYNSFREQKLHNKEVEVVFTMNEKPLRDIYWKKAMEARDTPTKPHNADWMNLENCITLFRGDLTLKLPSKIINQSYSMSKSTVISEFERDSL